jgi:hypothetical protein
MQNTKKQTLYQQKSTPKTLQIPIKTKTSKLTPQPASMKRQPATMQAYLQE